ncbi:MAG: hypothetical protein AB7G75_09230 [Candidatus Binatia bacterium]
MDELSLLANRIHKVEDIDHRTAEQLSGHGAPCPDAGESYYRTWRSRTIKKNIALRFV